MKKRLCKKLTIVAVFLCGLLLAGPQMAAMADPLPPDIQAAITNAAENPEALIQIVSDAVSANPDLAADITTAAVTANPSQTVEIATAVTQSVPEQREAVIAAATQANPNFSQQLAALNNSQTAEGYSTEEGSNPPAEGFTPTNTTEPPITVSENPPDPAQPQTASPI